MGRGPRGATRRDGSGLARAVRRGVGRGGPHAGRLRPAEARGGAVNRRRWVLVGVAMVSLLLFAEPAGAQLGLGGHMPATAMTPLSCDGTDCTMATTAAKLRWGGTSSTYL